MAGGKSPSKPGCSCNCGCDCLQRAAVVKLIHMDATFRSGGARPAGHAHMIPIFMTSVPLMAIFTTLTSLWYVWILGCTAAVLQRQCMLCLDAGMRACMHVWRFRCMAVWTRMSIHQCMHPFASVRSFPLLYTPRLQPESHYFPFDELHEPQFLSSEDYQQAQQAKEDRAREIFHKCDADRNGFLDIYEFMQVLRGTCVECIMEQARRDNCFPFFSLLACGTGPSCCLAEHRTPSIHIPEWDKEAHSYIAIQNVFRRSNTTALHQHKRHSFSTRPCGPREFTCEGGTRIVGGRRGCLSPLSQPSHSFRGSVACHK